MAEYKVIDVSYAQGQIDWESVKGNIDAAIIRCGYGNDDVNQDDTWWNYNVSECERLGIPYATYLYSYASSMEMAKSEAQHVIRLMQGHHPWRVYYDLEEPGLGAYSVMCANVFCPLIKEAGYSVGVYTFESWFNTYMVGYSKYPLWIAKVSDAYPNISVSYEGWQYTFSASIPGINGRCDCSRFWTKLWSGESSKQEEKQTAEAPLVTYGIMTLHHGVIADTGNGDPIGCENDAITGIKIGVSSGSIEYRVHLSGGGWLPRVSGNSWTDFQNGFAGDEINSIDAIQIFYSTDTSKTGGQYYEAVYSVRPFDRQNFLSEVHDTNWDGWDGEDTAGIFGHPFTEIKIKLEKC